MNRCQSTVPIALSDFLATTAKGYWVRIAATGKLAWLLKSQTQLFNSTAFVPEWLAKRVSPPGGDAKCIAFGNGHRCRVAI